MGLELVRYLRRSPGGGDQVPARDIHVGAEREGHRLAGAGFVEVARHGDDAFDRGADARGQDAYGVAGTGRASHDPAREAAEVGVGAADVLNRHAHRFRSRLGQMDRPQMRHQVGPAVPGHKVIGRRDIAARARAGRDGGHIGQADLFGEGAIVGDDGVEARLRALYEIHLVHGQHDPTHAQKRQQPAVSTRLGQHALARVDQHNGEISGRCRGDHIASVLLMPRRVGQDEAARADVEEAIGHVDGDALLPLGGEAVDEE